jgi:hypothetical protein
MREQGTPAFLDKKMNLRELGLVLDDLFPPRAVSLVEQHQFHTDVLPKFWHYGIRKAEKKSIAWTRGEAQKVCHGKYVVLTHGGRRADVAESIFPRIGEILAEE